MALTDNLVAYWKFDESSGNAEDSAGSNDLTNSSVSYASAKINNGAVTTGGGRLSISDASQSGLDFSTAFTFSWWQKKADSVATDVIVKWNTTGNQRAYYIQNWSDQKIYISLSDNGTNDPYWVSTNANSSAGDYFHWIITYDAGTIKVYRNNVEVAGSWVGTAPTSLFNSSADFILGYYNNSSLGFDIDEMGAWSRVITETERGILYNGGAGLQYPFVTGSSKFFQLF